MKKSIIILATVLFSLIGRAFEIRPVAAENLARAIHQKKIKFWTKAVWSTIDTLSQENYPLFFPYNQSPDLGFDLDKQDYTQAKMQQQKLSMKENLFNILRYHFLAKDIVLYLPFNPEWYVYKDNGLLQFPFSAELYSYSLEGNYFSDSLFKIGIKAFELIGYEEFNPNPEMIESIEYPGEDSITVDGNYIYYANDFIYYSDKDILKYKIREEWVMNESGEVVTKKIKAISPIIKRANGKMTETFWVDYEVLKKVLATYYVQVSNREEKKKVHTFAEYFSKRLFKSEIYKEEKTHLKPTEK